MQISIAQFACAGDAGPQSHPQAGGRDCLWLADQKLVELLKHGVDDSGGVYLLLPKDLILDWLNGEKFELRRQAYK